jgi:endogenous inhibitor of DNA gyrase (YacG/DUF329 family)
VPPSVARCPSCGKLTAWRDNSWRPFCSERCKLLDLGNWASERYRIPGPAVDKEQEEGTPPATTP